MEAIMTEIKELYLKNVKKFMIIDKREFDCRETRIYRIIKGYIFYLLLKSDQKTFDAFKCLR